MPRPHKLMYRILTIRLPRIPHFIKILVIFFAALGVIRSNFHDDIRSWVRLPENLLEQATHMAKLTGVGIGGTYLVIEAPDEKKLLQRSASLHDTLKHAQQSGLIESSRTIDMWLPPLEQRQAFKHKLAQWAHDKKIIAPLTMLGLPENNIETGLFNSAVTPNVTISDSLDNTWGTPWKDLFAGYTDGKVVALATVSGVRDVAELVRTVNHIDGVRVIDERTKLNTLFAHTRDSALILKIVSLLLAGLLLAIFKGVKQAWHTMSLPLFSVFFVLGTLGWLGISVGVFVLFGLLLVAAIGVDYAVCASSTTLQPKEVRAGILPAALTTMASFAILTFSSTPAVATFGLTVCIGTTINAVVAFWGVGRFPSYKATIRSNS